MTNEEEQAVRELVARHGRIAPWVVPALLSALDAEREAHAETRARMETAEKERDLHDLDVRHIMQATGWHDDPTYGLWPPSGHGCEATHESGGTVRPDGYGLWIATLGTYETYATAGAAVGGVLRRAMLAATTRAEVAERERDEARAERELNAKRCLEAFDDIALVATERNEARSKLSALVEAWNALLEAARNVLAYPVGHGAGADYRRARAALDRVVADNRAAGSAALSSARGTGETTGALEARVLRELADATEARSHMSETPGFEPMRMTPLISVADLRAEADKRAGTAGAGKGETTP